MTFLTNVKTRDLGTTATCTAAGVRQRWPSGAERVSAFYATSAFDPHHRALLTADLLTVDDHDTRQ